MSESSSDLEEQIAGWSPSPVSLEETLAVAPVRALRALLPADTAAVDEDRLPLLWHWVHFLRWPAQADLGPDGHPAGGGFLPPLRERRRMFAGGRCTVHAPLRLGHPAVSTSSVVRQAVKQGRSGALLFVTVGTRIEQDGAVRVEEEQDLVYRSGPAEPTPPTAPSPPGENDPAYAVREPRRFDPTVLFRFSAVTANSHRIHYDRPYAEGVELYPGLLVQGPLLVLSMAELLRRQGAGPVGRIEYRLKRPVFDGDAVQIAVDSAAEPRRAAVLGPGGAEHASARFDPDPNSAP